MQTKIKKYEQEWLMKMDINTMEKKGWGVLSVQREEGKYGCASVGCLGLIFLPLALLAKKKGKWVVVYQREVAGKTSPIPKGTVGINRINQCKRKNDAQVKIIGWRCIIPDSHVGWRKGIPTLAFSSLKCIVSVGLVLSFQLSV